MEIENVSIKKNDNLILKNVTFKDSGKDHWAILGESGSGKSTFLDLIAGKIFPSQGKISKSNHKKIVSVSRDYSFHRIIGSAYQYYQQRYNVYDSEVGPTVYEVLQNQILPVGTIDSASVKLPPLAHSQEKIADIAQQFKISTLLERKVTSLSNGETRRSLLAYWFLQDPDIMLLDNPFSGLDYTGRIELRDILQNFSGIQVFLVAELKDIPSNFHQALKWSGGEIVYRGLIEGIKEESGLAFTNVEEKLDKIRKSQEDEFSDFETALKLVNVNINYGAKHVLKDIHWEVKRGECWAVLGPNGSGKSTLMSLLTGDNPQAYKNEMYLFDRRRGTGESIWDIKQRIGFVSPELHLFFGKLTPVWKVIGSGFYDTMGLFRGLSLEQITIIDAYLDLFDIFKLREKLLSQLSSGQQRIIFLIRALVKNPQLLVLDEPCQGLDYNQIVFFRETLNKIVISQKKTLIYITHYLEEIPDCVNLTLHLDEGEVVKK
jgi:molybdate transport system ATP-binding protein